ncbi:MAG: uroporphyrinogen-III C-methyltransferase [Firmicutes bacterium]|nr:uroporphyrinogen-III C-methyltransferase [Bacillota bacterium]MCL5039942.1 uroporphyrinogen-III C-methyltransferase [Bacillota bacterium]
MPVGHVYLVGAGPGDPGLMTLRGLECLKKADVVVYDRLATPQLLREAKAGAEMVFAGKSPERHALTQPEINRLLVEKASQGLVVTRLKGGDPFIFGRGGEEAEELVRAGIPFEVVPGISSTTAVPAYAGIPVTHRGLSSSLAIVTGHEEPGKRDSSLRWKELATATDTLVFAMGMENLAHLSARLQENGRSPQTPVAVIQWGTRPEQKTVVGTLADIAAVVQAAGLTSPAIIVVGEVVRLREVLNWYEKKPLFGRRMLVTRSREQASALRQRLEDLGATVFEFPVIKILPLSLWEDWERIRDKLQVARYRFVVFSSANGVKVFLEGLLAQGQDARLLAGASLVAIGPKTAEELRRYGLRADLVPPEYRAEGLAAVLGKELEGTRGEILLIRSNIGRDYLAGELTRYGHGVEELVVYRTEENESGSEEIRRFLQEDGVDTVTFTSSSTVTNLLKLLGSGGKELLQGIKVACIGPVTADTARENGLPVAVVAKEYTIEGLVQALVQEATDSLRAADEAAVRNA